MHAHETGPARTPRDRTAVQRTEVDGVLRSAGRPLDASVRADMEARLGADFAGVRLHTGPAAARSAASIGARAYTSGDHVVLGEGGADRHTLAHELTHVIQQRQGTVAGTDHGDGLRLSDPSDRYERAAEANARRVLSRSVTPGATAPADASGDRTRPKGAVQRRVWVGGRRINPEADGLTDRMREMADDPLVRDYQNEREFRRHAAGMTDHLGNLAPGSFSPGTWVRFSPTGVNIVGENHTEVTLTDVVQAVGTRSFRYELVNYDDLTALPDTSATLDAMNGDRLARLGLTPGADLAQHGAESLFPKMGSALARLRPLLVGEKPDLDPIKEYLGQPVQRYLKTAWAFAVESSAAPVPSVQLTGPQQTLAQVVAQTQAVLGPFVAGLRPDGFLGNSMEERRGGRLDVFQRRSYKKEFVPALRAFCDAFLPVIRERAGSDQLLSTFDRNRIAGTTSDVQSMEAWRDAAMLTLARRAASDGTRYIGLGGLHVGSLIGQLGTSGGYHFFYLNNGRQLAEFQQLTQQRLAGVAAEDAAFAALPPRRNAS
ncbi:DUF4157 domain-containing protein [Kineosporia sp. J2-2]|uniref:DUF4157 domain-containing protein n=1 Tax=Kineosporia corallincola TaxID=2835133 RepID=A0ABS5TR87_9ACTN|nr:DUF4157 domain-containing protein [Kineosporia corallincola]MBT0772884.1 DUF4157 domain-containing protein [Kineosporia corallincola]